MRNLLCSAAVSPTRKAEWAPEAGAWCAKPVAHGTAASSRCGGRDFCFDSRGGAFGVGSMDRSYSESGQELGAEKHQLPPARAHRTCLQWHWAAAYWTFRFKALV